MEASHLNTNQSRSLDRKTIEKNRRMQMKALYSELISHLPNHTSRETLTLPDQLDEAAKYIKKLQVNVEKMEERKRKLIATSSFERLNSAGSSSSIDVSVSRRLPKLEIQETGSIFHIILVTSLEHKFVFYEIIRILTEEVGAEITHAGYSMVDDSLFHTLHCKVEECNYGARRQIPDRLEKNPSKKRTKENAEEWKNQNEGQTHEFKRTIPWNLLTRYGNYPLKTGKYNRAWNSKVVWMVAQSISGHSFNLGNRDCENEMGITFYSEAGL